MGSIRLSRSLKSFSRRFTEAGYDCYLVGGAVRNMLLEIPTDDFDIATNAKPDEVMRLFRRVIPTGIRHGTVTVLHRGLHMEVTTFRTESQYGDSRRPDGVEFVGSIDDDLSRRDFTMNAVAVDCRTGEVIDPTGGMIDIDRCLIRAIGDPGNRFSEDGLRLIRACRFAAQLGFTIHPDTFDGIRTNLPALRGVSPERIRDELFKILASPVPSVGVLAMAESGILAIVLPELDACRGVEQKGFHRHDVFVHSLFASDAALAGDLEVRTSALLHDIGKPIAKAIDDNGIITFHRHEEHSEYLARKLLYSLKCPKAFTETVCHLIRHHMFHYEPSWTDAAIRRFVRRVTPEHLDKLFSLRSADSAAISGHHPVLVARRGHKARDHQLPLVQAGARWSVLRAHLWAGEGLELPLRQVQGDPLSRRGL